MNRDPVVLVEDVTLAFRIGRSQVGTMKEFAINSLKGNTSYEKLWALKGVSFDLHEGEVLGIIGPNGAGKSTLMKIIAQVLPPTGGRVRVSGSIAPMIELGAGFNSEMTGVENIVLYGTLLGRDPKEMRERVGAIAEWAELQEFIDTPIRNYSSGMLARLGFAVATDQRPDVLVVDEVLSVGDESFQRKSAERIERMIADGTSVVLV
ncbi:MAG: ABC transporter ATP-binding protein, partial [Acidimicrobiia bacterium]|nr:ABC transporter ATP-binding protein [Acidimicrobiia bacterium]